MFQFIPYITPNIQPIQFQVYNFNPPQCLSFQAIGRQTTLREYYGWRRVIKQTVYLILEFIEQKLEYIHMNPCRCTPPLTGHPDDYMHSSAKYYYTQVQGIYEVTDYMGLQDIDLTREGNNTTPQPPRLNAEIPRGDTAEKK